MASLHPQHHAHEKAGYKDDEDGQNPDGIKLLNDQVEPRQTTKGAGQGMQEKHHGMPQTGDEVDPGPAKLLYPRHQPGPLRSAR